MSESREFYEVAKRWVVFELDGLHAGIDADIDDRRPFRLWSTGSQDVRTRVARDDWHRRVPQRLRGA